MTYKKVQLQVVLEVAILRHDKMHKQHAQEVAATNMHNLQDRLEQGPEADATTNRLIREAGAELLGMVKAGQYVTDMPTQVDKVLKEA